MSFNITIDDTPPAVTVSFIGINYTNRSDPTESKKSRYTRLFLVFPLFLFIIFLSVYNFYFSGSTDPLHQSDLNKFLFMEIFKITLFIYLVYSIISMTYSLKNLLKK